jgi:hypothetical protein
MKFLAPFLLLSAVACAPLTEDQIYEREVRLIEAEDKFLEKKADCARRRGVMVYDYRQKGRLNSEPDAADMVTARCDTTMDGALGIY